MKNASPTEVELAWMAGFFDGEGHVRIQKHSARGSYMLSISAVQAHAAPLEIFVKKLGGTLKRRLMPYRGKLRVLWTWQTSSHAAQVALELMLPYLVVKKDEALLALEFRKTFRPQYGERSKNSESLEAEREKMMYGLQEIRKAKLEVVNS